MRLPRRLTIVSSILQRRCLLLLAQSGKSPERGREKPVRRAAGAAAAAPAGDWRLSADGSGFKRPGGRRARRWRWSSCRPPEAGWDCALVLRWGPTSTAGGRHRSGGRQPSQPTPHHRQRRPTPVTARWPAPGPAAEPSPAARPRSHPLLCSTLSIRPSSLLGKGASIPSTSGAAQCIRRPSQKRPVSDNRPVTARDIKRPE